MKKKFEKTNCPVCEARSANFFAEKNGFNLHRCFKCGLIFVWPVSGDYAKIYSEKYFSGAKDSLGYADYEGEGEIMAGTFRVYLEKIEKFSPNKGRLLDVGAATGHFLKLAGERGWRAQGLEISEYAAGVGREKGLKITVGNFETYDAPENHFDTVTFWDVLEHFEKPDAAIRQAGKILKSGGILAVNTPDSASLAAKFFGRHWHALVPPNHLHVFSRKNLDQLLAKYDFEIIETARVGKKFSLRFIFKVLSGWQKMKIWERAYERSLKKNWGKWKIPLDFRDNMFIIAKKS